MYLDRILTEIAAIIKKVNNDNNFIDKLYLNEQVYNSIIKEINEKGINDIFSNKLRNKEIYGIDIKTVNCCYIFILKDNCDNLYFSDIRFS